jgi:hypothetical protein
MARPTFITDEQWRLLLEHGARSAAGEELDPHPVLLLELADPVMFWMLTEVDPHDEDRAFGLCDLGLGMPELGYVSLSEIAALRGRGRGQSVQADATFVGDRPLSIFRSWARMVGWIVR